MSTSSDTADFEVPVHPAGWDRPRLFSALVQVDLGGLSHRGRVRPNNEDHFFVARFGRYLEKILSNLPADEIPPRLEETGYGAVVADGIGGTAAGEVASRLAITTLVNLVLGTPDWIMRLEDDALAEEIRRRTLERIGQISAVMAEQAQADPALREFGTTLTLAVSLGRDLFITHVGDSRAYVLRRQRLIQLTRDHTLAQTLVDSGLLAPRDVATNRLRHVLTRSLGAQGGPVQADVQEIVLEDGDNLLLCTDGLTEMIGNDQIAAILGSAATAEKACQSLVDGALKAGGKDNVTVVVARYRFPSGPASSPG